MKLVFADVVVIDGYHIGVVVKCWGAGSNGREPYVDVYVQSYNQIKEYPVSKVERYLVRHKYLDEDEMEYQRNAEAAA